jgi:HK97 family phage portal protein
MGFRTKFIEFLGGQVRTNAPTGSGLWESMTQTSSGVSISKHNAMTISGVYSAVRVLSDAISILPIDVIQERNGSKEKLSEHPVYKLLNSEPNALMTSFVYRQIIMQNLLLWGNAYSIIEWQKGGSYRPIALMPFHPSKVEVVILDGVLVYKFKIENGDDIVLDQSNVLHFRGLGDEVMGKSVIDYAKDNLALGKAAEDFGSTFFANGANQSGILTTDQVLSDTAIKNLRNSLEKNHGGVSNAQKTMILEQGLKYQTTSVPPDSAQFLETRKFSINDIARWFKVPPHKIGDLERATFSNIEEMNLDFAKESVLPYSVGIEQECTRKLLRESEKKTTKCKMDLDEILRGDIATRATAYKEYIQNGVISPNEVRNKEDMNPYKGGDSKFMALNLAPIKENGTNQAENEEN